MGAPQDASLRKSLQFKGLTAFDGVFQLGAVGVGGVPRILGLHLPDGSFGLFYAWVKKVQGADNRTIARARGREAQVRNQPKAFVPYPASALTAATSTTTAIIQRVEPAFNPRSSRWGHPEHYPTSRAWLMSVLDTEPTLTATELVAIMAAAGLEATKSRATHAVRAWRAERGYKMPLPRGNPQLHPDWPAGGWSANWEPTPVQTGGFNPRAQHWPKRFQQADDESWIRAVLNVDGTLTTSQVLELMGREGIGQQWGSRTPRMWANRQIAAWRASRGYGMPRPSGAPHVLARLFPDSAEPPANWLPASLEELREIVDPRPYGAGQKRRPAKAKKQTQDAP